MRVIATGGGGDAAGCPGYVVAGMRGHQRVRHVTHWTTVPFQSEAGSTKFRPLGSSRLDSGMDEPKTLRIVVADDDPLARRTIKDALRRAGITVVADAHDGREAVEHALYYRPDVVLMDVVMPGLDGIAATRKILKEIPDQVIILISTGDEDEVAILGLQAGAAGYLSKDIDLGVLPRALRGAYNGEAVVSRRMSMQLVEHLRRAPKPLGTRTVNGHLTPREWEVLDLVCERLGTDQIADALVLSPETVRSHVKHILRKLDARSREEAITVARRIRRAA